MKLEVSRRQLMGSMSVCSFAGLAGCLGGKERPYRGEVVKDVSFEGEELDPTGTLGTTLPAQRYSEIVLSANINRKEEGYEKSPQIDIVTFRNENIDKWANRESYDVVSDGTIRNVDQKVDRSFRVKPGLYFVFAIGQGKPGGEGVEIDFEAKIYNYYRKKSNVSCDSSIPTEIAYLNMDADVIDYHIQIGKTKSEKYKLEILVESENNEKSFTKSVEPGLCSTNFAGSKELDMDDLNMEDARVTVSVENNKQNVVFQKQGMVSTRYWG